MISRKIAEKNFEKLLTNSEICDIINKLSQRNSMRHGTLKTEQYSERIKPMCEVAIPSNEFEQGKK